MKNFFIVILFLLFPAVLFGQLQKGAGDKDLFESAKPARIEGADLTPQKIEDLAALGKIWGFLKYYHPRVAAGTYNWDAELLRVMPDIIAAQSRLERNEILNNWVKSLGAFDIAGPVNPTDVKLNPDLSWIDSRTLGIKLAKQLSLVKSAARTKNFYLSFAVNGNPVFQNEDPYAAMSYPDTGYRLLALFRYWSVIQYFYPNRHLTGENWNSVMNEFIPRFYRAANELEYKRTALALIGRIHDTHANIWGNDAAIQTYNGLNAAAVRVRFVENKAVVTEYWNQSHGPKSGLLPGDVIESVDGKSVTDMISERLEYYPASNYSTQLRDIGVHLLRTNANTINVAYTRDGIGHSATLAAYPWQSTIDYNLIYYRSVPPFSVIDNNIAYIYAGSIPQGQSNSYRSQINPTRGLIVDLRCYPTDFLPFTIGSYVMPGPTNFTRYSVGDVATPGLFTYVPGNVIPGTPVNSYNKKIVVLVNELTQSQAEYTALAFRASPRATVIGSTTAGADGDISFFYLPGNIRTAISGIGIFYADGRETQRVGIVPDIFMTPTIQGVKDGRDELLEKAIQLINAN